MTTNIDEALKEIRREKIGAMWRNAQRAADVMTRLKDADVRVISVSMTDDDGGLIVQVENADDYKKALRRLTIGPEAVCSELEQKKVNIAECVMYIAKLGDLELRVIL